MINESNDERWVELNVALIRWEDSIAALNFMRDITNQKTLEAQFRQAQRMESVGTLAGGIAHDFNNLLMGIQGNASVMLMEVESDHPHHESLKSIERCVKSGANLTRQLLGFARGGKYVTRPVDLNEIVQRTSEIFGRTRREVRIHHGFERNVQAVNADVNQIEQVLLNLYVNAWQAMPGGGELHLGTRNVRLGMAEVRRRPFAVKPGEYVRISVTDTGVGMSAKVQQRIFEPFFTTKEVGKGTGLGLASAYGIVKNHGGFIEVDSAPGKGSRFTIYLPAAEKLQAEKLEPSQEALKGTETILLVDDEAVVLNVGKRMLEALGYRVLVAEDGPQALEKFQRSGDTIDLVVLDMVMPNMNGGEVFDRIRSIDSEMKVLLASGYSLSGEAEEIMQRGCNGFIQKPFDAAQLSRKIRSVLAVANEEASA
jgi:signal transduction histidine kinase/ActR/RegA family two-component response regulator